MPSLDEDLPRGFHLFPRDFQIVTLIGATHGNMPCRAERERMQAVTAQ
jgi:hypothetical protein